jgi:hypothetical protein
MRDHFARELRGDLPDVHGGFFRLSQNALDALTLETLDRVVLVPAVGFRGLFGRVTEFLRIGTGGLDLFLQ